jgi:hypothetical protein
MSGEIPSGVLTTREARKHLSDFLKEARQPGPGTVRFYGAQRKAEAAIMPADLAESLLDLMDDVVIAERIRDRTENEPRVSGTVEEFLAGAGLDVEHVRRLRRRRRSSSSE